MKIKWSHDYCQRCHTMFFASSYSSRFMVFHSRSTLYFFFNFFNSKKKKNNYHLLFRFITYKKKKNIHLSRAISRWCLKYWRRKIKNVNHRKHLSAKAHWRHTYTIACHHIVSIQFPPFDYILCTFYHVPRGPLHFLSTNLDEKNLFAMDLRRDSCKFDREIPSI